MFRILCIFAIGIVGFGHPMTRAKLAPPFPIYIGQDLERAKCMKFKNQNFIGRGEGVPHLTKRKMVYGIGVNDAYFSTGSSNKREPSYTLWKSILARCYGKLHKKQITYLGCSVCNEWLVYSNFKKWFDDPANGYRKGYHIDKDILIRGNKVYSPETCCFVPPEINTLIVKHDATRGDLPIGVSRNKNNLHGYRAIIRIYGKYTIIGYYSTPLEAFSAYKYAKEAHIQEMATRYYNDGKITEMVYKALMNYKVEITD